MARTVAELPPGARITDCISLGVIAKTFPLPALGPALSKTGKASLRERDLPGAGGCLLRHSTGAVHAIVLSRGIALSAESSPVAARSVGRQRVAGKSGISQARTRLDWEPLRQLHDELFKPVAARSTRGAWYRGWRLVSLDGSTFDVAGEKANEEAFSRPGASRGESAYPQIRFVSPGGERHTRAVWQPYGRLPDRRNHTGKAGCSGFA